MNEPQQDNPFASPLSREILVKDQPIMLAERRPWSMLLVGVFYGTTLGVIAGGLAAGTIGFVAIVVEDPTHGEIGPIGVVIFGTVLGAIQGGWMGAVIGGVAGLISGLMNPLSLAVPKRTSAVLAGIGGGVFGALAGELVLGNIEAILASAVLAAAVGFITGAFLGRSIGAISIRNRGIVTAPADFAGCSDNPVT
jgi:hypothetical protein